MDLEEALKIKRYSAPAHPLHFRIPPDQLMDEEFCDQLMQNIEERFEAKWEHLTAHTTLAARLPDLPGLYMFVWKPFFSFKTENGSVPIRMVVYIGKAGGAGSEGTLKSRYAAEYSKIVGSNPLIAWDPLPADASRDDKLQLYLNIHELEYWFITLNNQSNIPFIKVYEKSLIKLISPPCNTEHIRASISKTPQPAF